MIRVIVTGASGFLGAKLGEKLIKHPNDYSCLGLYYNYHDFSSQGSNLSIRRVDIQDANELSTCVHEFRPEVIIHCAALTNIEYCEKHKEEAYNINVVGTENLLRCCEESGAKLVFISTDIVFDGKKALYTEETEPKPINHYGVTKAKAEDLVKSGLTKPQWLILRLSVQYGNHPFNRRADFVRFVVERMRKRERVKLFTDKYRNVTYIDWTVETILKLILRGKTGIFHVCGSECLNYFQWGEMIAGEFGLPMQFLVSSTLTTEPTTVNRPGKIALDNSKLKVELGEDALMPSIKETLKVLKDRAAY
ncbi:SDR family oxidoreductase [[Eubacterium] cellulosolvens]